MRKWRTRVCCLEAYAVAAFYFGPGELSAFHCNTHGEVRVRSEGAAVANYETNDAIGVAHLGGNGRYAPVPSGTN